MIGLRINDSNAKVESTQPRPGFQFPFSFGGVPLEDESFKYLGSFFTATGQAEEEISGRKGPARSAFTHLKLNCGPMEDIAQK